MLLRQLKKESLEKSLNKRLEEVHVKKRPKTSESGWMIFMNNRSLSVKDIIKREAPQTAHKLRGMLFSNRLQPR